MLGTNRWYATLPLLSDKPPSGLDKFDKHGTSAAQGGHPALIGLLQKQGSKAGVPAKGGGLPQLAKVGVHGFGTLKVPSTRGLALGTWPPLELRSSYSLPVGRLVSQLACFVACQLLIVFACGVCWVYWVLGCYAPILVADG